MIQCEQKDLYGNTVVRNAEEERTLMFVSTYTRDLYRQVKLLLDMPMMDAAELGLKSIVAIMQKTNISEEEIDKILHSKDIEEITNILKNAFQYLK